MAKTFETKPHNDPWTKSAMRCPKYKTSVYGHRDASRMSWRRLSKMMQKHDTHSYQRLGSCERRILRAQARLEHAGEY